MEKAKSSPSSPSLRTPFPPLRAAGDPVGAASPPRGRLARTRGALTDRPANRRYSWPPTRVALAPDCPGSRHLHAAWPAASVAAAHAGTRPPRNTFDCELADTAERTCRKRRTADRPSYVPSPDNLSRVRYRSAVNGLVTNSRMPEKPIIHRVHSGERTWVNSRERQGRASTPQQRVPCMTWGA